MGAYDRHNSTSVLLPYGTGGGQGRNKIEGPKHRLTMVGMRVRPSEQRRAQGREVKEREEGNEVRMESKCLKTCMEGEGWSMTYAGKAFPVK